MGLPQAAEEFSWVGPAPAAGIRRRRAQDVGRDEHVRTLVVNWWSSCPDLTLEVFGQDGGRAGGLSWCRRWESNPHEA